MMTGALLLFREKMNSLGDVISHLKYNHSYVDRDSIEVYKLIYELEPNVRYSNYDFNGKINGYNESSKYKLINKTKCYPINESKTNKNMEKNVIKLNENTLRQIVAESVKKILKEHAWASASTFKELQIVLDKVTGILRKFSNNIPQEHSDEFMKLVGREWNALWESLSSIEETVMHINNPRGLSDGDLTFDDLS